MQTLQQQRAKYALDKITYLATLNEGAKLKSRASELPFMIHVNGLGQAAAFFKSKKDKDGYGRLFDVLQGWLSQSDRPFAGQPDLMRAITEADMHQYRVAQAEAIQFMDWVKKFASAYLKGGDDESSLLQK